MVQLVSSVPIQANKSTILTWLHRQLPHFNHRAQVALRRRMEHNGYRARYTQQAANHAKHIKLLVKECMRQHSTVQYSSRRSRSSIRARAGED